MTGQTEPTPKEIAGSTPPNQDAYLWKRRIWNDAVAGGWTKLEWREGRDGFGPPCFQLFGVRPS